MASAADFVEELRETIASGEAPIITGNSSDIYSTSEFPVPARLPQLIALANARDERRAVLYSLGRGAVRFTAPGTEAAPIKLPGGRVTMGDALPALLDAAMTCSDPILVIIDHASSLVPAGPHSAAPSQEQAVVLETLQHTVTEPSFTASGHGLVLIARGEIHQRLSQSAGFRTVRVPLPDAEDLERMLELVRKRAQDEPQRYSALEEDVSDAEAAAACKGLRCDDLVNLSRQAAVRRRSVTFDDLNRRKAITLEREARGTLRQLRTGMTLDDVAALAHVKRYIRELLQSDNAWPGSILLAGPPGVGKTFVVAAIARELRRHLLMFHRIRAMWFGESEANQTLAFDVIRDLSPNVVMIDEADQELGARSTGPSADGGTSGRLLANLLTFTGDGGPKDVLFCMTSNRPDLLDTANLSRVQVVPILHPTPSDIVELLPTLARQADRRLDEDVDVQALSRHPKLRLTSARHLTRILARAATLSDLKSSRGSSIAQAQLVQGIDDYIPHTDSNMEELMALSALELTTFQTLMPWTVGKGQMTEVPAYVTPLLDPTGALDQDLLRGRLVELRARVGR